LSKKLVTCYGNGKYGLKFVLDVPLACTIIALPMTLHFVWRKIDGLDRDINGRNTWDKLNSYFP
jgi:hypothetical protein